ncbi:MAG: hypothetical protein MK135_10225, partial [Polyangiaceae bacterium]|nr:hypothetical protein [Polyangiaceae bacterium]
MRTRAPPSSAPNRLEQYRTSESSSSGEGKGLGALPMVDRAGNSPHPKGGLAQQGHCSMAVRSRPVGAFSPPVEVDWWSLFFWLRSLAQKWGKRWFFLGCFGGCLGVLIAFFLPPGGSASAEFMLNRQIQLNPVEESNTPAFFLAPEKTFLAMPLVEETRERLGWESSLTALQETIENLSLRPTDSE